MQGEKKCIFTNQWGYGQGQRGLLIRLVQYCILTEEIG